MESAGSEVKNEASAPPSENQVPNDSKPVESVKTGLPQTALKALLIESASRTPVSNAQLEDDDDLSPPPDHIPSPTHDDPASGDEIVVSSNRNGADKSSPFRVVSDQEDETMGDADEDLPYRPQTSPYPKRKRQLTTPNVPVDDEEEGSPTVDEVPIARAKPVRRPAGADSKTVVLGYWRDSQHPIEAEKHAVVGFIDVRERLRTRIADVNRMRQPVDTKQYPVPPGPGGSWVTFERVVFEPQLVGLNHHHIKEFVKQRAGVEGESPETKRQNDMLAVAEARRRLERNPASETAPTPAVAYGLTIPEDAVICSRSEIAKRRKLGSTTQSGVGTISGGGPILNSQGPPQQQPQMRHPLVQELPPMHSQVGPRRSLPDHAETNERISPVPVFEALWGTRPTRIVVGYWKPSNAPHERDRHAVLGILGTNDMFRVKVVRETRDGRYVDGNFPVGAGALWIQWPEMEPEPHLKDLSRTEVKEYVRVRQYQIDRGETEAQKVRNETHAVFIAQQRVMHGVKIVPPPGTAVNGNGIHGRHDEDMPGPEDPDLNDAYVDSKQVMKAVFNGQELRSNGRRPDAPHGRHSLPNLESRHSSKTPIAARRDIDNQARREIGRLEQAEVRRAQFALDREAAVANANLGMPMQHGSQLPPMQMVNNNHGRASLGHSFHAHDDLQRLESVWQMQEEQRNKLPPPPPPPAPVQAPPPAHAPIANGNEVKYHDGIRYERKPTGNFAGKLVSTGSLISIDGEDYIEYRLLTKPSF
ncbi:hypothetical protein ACHAQH_006162 [Verticillium albo-atrum]